MNNNSGIVRISMILAAGTCAAFGSQALAQSMSYAGTSDLAGELERVAPFRYNIIDLGSLYANEQPTDDIYANGYSMNEHGDVCGLAEKGPYGFGYGSGGFVWDYATGVMTEVIDAASVSGLSDNLYTAGSWAQPWGTGFGSRPFLAGNGVTMHDPTVGIGNFGQGITVNNSGQMAAEVDGSSYFVDSDGTVTQFKLPTGSLGGDSPSGMNNHGVVTGKSLFDHFRFHAIRYDSATDTITDLHDPAWWKSNGIGINDRGDIAGYAIWDINGGDWIPAVVWTAEGDVIEFALYEWGPGYAWDGASDINRHGDVVGGAGSFIRGQKSIGWVSFDVRKPKHTGIFTDPNRPVRFKLRDLLTQPQRSAWKKVGCTEINDARQIIGTGVHNGRTRAFLADPVPVIDGDFNLDGALTLDDVRIIIDHYGEVGVRPLEGDLNGDRTVDLQDVILYLELITPSARTGGTSIQRK